MLRIILGYRTARTLTETPEVLYCGHSGVAAQGAIDSAPPDITSFGRIEGVLARRGKRAKAEAPAVEPALEGLSESSDEEISESADLGQPVPEEEIPTLKKSKSHKS